MAGTLGLKFAPQVGAELSELDIRERAKVDANMSKFLCLPMIPGGKAEMVRAGCPVHPAIVEFRVNVQSHWIRLLFATCGAVRVVLLCIVKKTNRLRSADIDVAVKRAKELGLGRVCHS